jgi:hypothetical protein
MATNPYENPYNQQQNQNPYQQPQQQQQQQQQQPSWTGAAAGTTTSTGAPQTGNIYGAYTGQQSQPQRAPQQPQPASWGWPQQGQSQQQQPQAWYGQAQQGAAPQGQYPQQFNYTQQQPNYSQAPTQWQQPGGMPTGQPQAQVDTRSWNTDGFARPQYVAPKAAPHPMPGWDRAKWADPNHQTPKYVIGRILSGIKPRTANMDQAVALIAQAYPGTRRTGSGDITIPGIGSTDILKAADVGGKAWHFGGQSKGAPAAQQPAQAYGQQPQGAAGVDPYTALLQSLVAPQAQAPQAQAAGQWESSPQYQQMAEQMAALQQQMATWQQQATAQQAQQAARGPQFSYY